MVKTINVSFDNEEYDFLKDAKIKSGLGMRKFLLKLVGYNIIPEGVE